MTMNLDPLSKVDNLFQWVDTFVQKPSLEGHGPIYALLGKMMIFGTEGKLGGQQSEVIVAINDGQLWFLRVQSLYSLTSRALSPWL